MVTIYGAGMAGLLAAQMLRRYNPAVHEAQTELPDNHGALLRFRTDAVQQATGIPLKRVQVFKAIKPEYAEERLRDRATLADANAYSLKVTGELHERSALNTEPATRFIAPDNFISELSRGVDITFNSPLSAFRLGELPAEAPLISTIPMPALMDMVEWQDKPEFRFRSIYSASVTLLEPRVNVYQTIYYPYHQPYYRASITGTQLILEYTGEAGTEHPSHIAEVLTDFGFTGASEVIHSDIIRKHQRYGKLIPLEEHARRSFILALSDRYNVYSLGRFATWRQILMDDVVKDVKAIERFITERGSYARRSHWG